MNIVLASIFRNSTGYLDRYFGQATRLAGALARTGDTLKLMLAEGDSSDDTYHSLMNDRSGLDTTVIKAEHGGPVFGSIDNDQRWRNISFVCNTLLQAITDDPFPADAVVYVESDLFWHPEMMVTLLGHLNDLDIDAVAPMCFHLPTGLFYDTWGHRKDGIRFIPYPPYHPHLVDDPTGLTRIDSAGSCIVMSRFVARNCRFEPPERGIVGFGDDMRRLQFQLWLDPAQRVLHP